MIDNFRSFTGSAFRDDQIRAHLEFCNFLYENSIERFYSNNMTLLGQSSLPMLGPVQPQSNVDMDDELKKAIAASIEIQKQEEQGIVSRS